MKAVPDPHRGTKGTCLGPAPQGAPQGPLVVILGTEKEGEEGEKRIGGGEDEGEK